MTGTMNDAILEYWIAQAVSTWLVTGEDVGRSLTRPSVLFRPRISVDGNQWCALYGENLQDGVAGFGDTPAAAMAAFDRAWSTETASAAGEKR